MSPELRDSSTDRLVINRLSRASGVDTFREDVRAGLTSTPKLLSPKYFYDDLGSKLFEAICLLPEYYLTRAESEILSRYADEIVAMIEGQACLVELGSGSADKTRYLIEALLRRQSALHYLPIDISDISLEQSSAVLLHSYPRLKITAYAADYFTALEALARAGVTERECKRTIALFLGSNIGNFNPDESLVFLREVRRMLKPEDGLLLGADLKKSADVLLPAYDDALGLTAAFNRNLLVRINRELGGNFRIDAFEHRPVYNESLGRLESYLVSRAPQVVRIEALDLEVRFEQGEAIHTENSYKFTLEQLSALARQSGFTLQRSWFDSLRRFSFNLFAAAEID